MIAKLRALYEGETHEAHGFRYGLLAFDFVTVVFIVTTSFLERGRVLEAVDAVFGAVIALEFVTRIMVSRRRLHEFAHLSTRADLVAIASFLAPIVGEGGGFLRVLRTLRLIRTYHVSRRLRNDSAFFRRNEDAIAAAFNLSVFLFVMTGLVYETQHRSNPDIGNYADALYFTVTALTTTGFGDITLPGTSGRMISVVIMIFGVTLFLRLAQVLFRPYKVRHSCPACGLARHEPDAVHCKACGDLLNIPNDESY